MHFWSLIIGVCLTLFLLNYSKESPPKQQEPETFNTAACEDIYPYNRVEACKVHFLKEIRNELRRRTP